MTKKIKLELFVDSEHLLHLRHAIMLNLHDAQLSYNNRLMDDYQKEKIIVLEDILSQLEEQ